MFEKLKNTIVRNKWKLIIVLVCFVVGFVVVNQITATSDATKKESYKVGKKNLEERLTISGQMEAREKATLRFQTSGYLSWIGVKEGDVVKKFQTLASLDQRVLQKQVQKDLLDYQTTRWNFDQTKDNYKDQIYSDTIKRTVDKSQFSLNSSVLDVEIADIALRFGNLWTPIDGVVTKVGAPNAGVNITPSQAEIEVVNPKTFYFSATADQTEIMNINEGQHADLVLDSYPDETIILTVEHVSLSPKAGESSVVYEVRLPLSETLLGRRLLLGMTGDVSFVTQSKNDVLAIPPKFIKSEKGKKYVLALRGGKTEKVFVETGLDTESLVEIKKGLFEGDTVYSQ